MEIVATRSRASKQAWFKTFLTLRNGIPSHDTFNRVMAALRPEAFLDRFPRWTQSLRQAVAHEIVALDGKALRRIGGPKVVRVEAEAKHALTNEDKLLARIFDRC